MAEHNDLGNIGEALAKSFLESAGYEVLATNWRYRKCEVDIVARDGDCIVIAEVKTRRTNFFGEPEEFVTRDKQRNLVEAASAYIVQKELDCEVRFDIISVLYNDGKHKIYHIKDAFYAVARR